MRARLLVATTVLASIGLLASGTAAVADTETIDDDAGDVMRFEANEPVAEPRADILGLEVTHEARLLRIEITVAELTPLDDPAWDAAALQVSAALSDPDSSDPFGGFWVWSFAADGGSPHGELISFSSDEITPCFTDASVDEDARSYILTADESCLRDVPRSIGVQANVSYDDAPDDDDFDFSTDFAPEELSDPIGSSGAPPVTRVAGIDRIETAIALSADVFDEGEAAAAVLASSGDFPDAIAGAPLARLNGGPLLLSGRDELDGRVRDELERAVEPGGVVYLLGGTGVLGPAVESAVRSAGFRPARVAGVDRYATAVAIAERLPDRELVLIADGRRFEEGLVAGAAAAATGGAVVLTDGGRLPASTDEFLASDPHRHLAVGAAAAAAPGAERIVATSVAELSQKVLDRLQPRVSSIAVAGVRTFADALAGAPHIAFLAGGLLLTDSDELSGPVAEELRQRGSLVREVVLYGGTASLSEGVAEAIAAAVTSS
jgi:hypothetical protein